jgi:hypothetical protein
MNTYNTEIAAVKQMNPVNAGLLYAAHELERAQAAKIKADAEYKIALAEFKARFA